MGGARSQPLQQQQKQNTYNSVVDIAVLHNDSLSGWLVGGCRLVRRGHDGLGLPVGGGGRVAGHLDECARAKKKKHRENLVKIKT